MIGDTSSRILVAGSINTDLVVQVATAPARGETVTGSAFAMYGGGKGANQAVAAARSGSKVAMLGGVGADDFGRQRLETLDREGIACDTVKTYEHLPSGVALITVESTGENRIAYVPGATSGVDSSDALAALRAWQPSCVLATLELPYKTLAALFGKCREQGTPVLCNATPEPSEAKALAFSADVLIVNEIEAAELLDLDREPESWNDAARELRDAGLQVVVITLGSSGALVSSSAGELAIPALKVGVVDSTGAGDAFCGAFATELARGSDPFDSAKVGVVAGSLAVTRPGAQPSMPTRAEIEERLNA